MASPIQTGLVVVAGAENIELGELINLGVKTLSYTYDFSDNWEHTIEIESISEIDRAHVYPRFIDGQRRAPPEDVGGIPGYEQFLIAMADPRHPAHKKLLKWYGRLFDPDDIELASIKKNLRDLSQL